LTEAQSLTLTDRYYSGILYFKLEEYQQAAEQLAVVGEREDSLGQNGPLPFGRVLHQIEKQSKRQRSFQKSQRVAL